MVFGSMRREIANSLDTPSLQTKNSKKSTSKNFPDALATLFQILKTPNPEIHVLLS